MRALAAILLLLASLVFAETQDSVYFLALKAEEAGDIPGSLSLFETALELPGPNTEEIREILKEYYEALGMDIDEKEGSVSFRFSSDVGAYGILYNEYGGVHALKERGGDFFVMVEALADFYSNGWMNTFGISFMTDWFLNDDMQTLDTNDWVLTPSLEYSLIGRNFMWDVGLDFKMPEGSSMEVSWYSWIEETLLHHDRHSLGVSLWDYFDSEGPIVLAAYATWRRSSTMGLNLSASAGMRFDADSVVNVDAVLEEDVCERDPEGRCVAAGPEAEGSDGGEVKKLPEDDLAEIDDDIPMYLGKWLGPTLRLRASHKFRYNLSVKAKLNLFYGFVVDWPCENGDDMRKFSGAWGLQVNWNPSFFTVYLGAEQIYLHYSNMSDSYVGLYPKNSFLTEAKLGVKAEF